MSLNVTSREKEPGVFLFALEGSLDTETYPILEARVDELLKVQPRSFIFDFANLKYLSSMGIRVVFKAKKALSASGGDVIFTNLQPQVEKVFEIINALPTFQVFKSTEELDAYLDKMQKKVLDEE